jgi:arabinogalactan oligomer / maltooligosaccharide transport system permease protein
MTTIDRLEEAEAPFAGSKAAETPGPTRLGFGDLWWRYVVSLLAIAFAVFPALYVLSAAFNPVPSLSSASLIPDSLTLENFREILTNPTIEGEKTNVHYVNWYVNSMVVAFFAALCTVILGALAAYAFARFRFKGRRMGMLTLLLIQMFPQFLAVVAIYLILLRTGEIFPVIGLNSRTGLIIVYLGGALGVNAWLMKGFFDSIPNELDESARVDGATPAQVFWGIILPLGAPVLAVVGLLSFIATLNEYIIASRLLQSTNNFTLPVGMYGFISDQYGQRWGPFCAGVVLASIPVIIVFLFLQRFIVHGLTSGSVKG